MISSMTAYAQASRQVSGIQTDLEIRSYNSRHLDVVTYLPRAVSSLEDQIKKNVAQQVSRGRVEVRLAIETTGQETVVFSVDEDRARGYLKALEKLKTSFNLPGEICLETLLDGRDMIRAAEAGPDEDLLSTVVLEVLDQALGQLVQMRCREGENLAGDLEERLRFLEAGIDQVEALAGELPTLYRKKLDERISALTAGIEALDPVRLAQEAAFLADKSDISEEIVRARSHVSQFRQIIAADEPGGRKLNFLVQEFNREFNTMGSKAGKAALSHLIVDMKSELEKIREQVQNIE